MMNDNSARDEDISCLRWVIPVMVTLFIELTGCGPSQEEMLMRAAQRRRAPDPSETAQAEVDSKEPTQTAQTAEEPGNTQQPLSIAGNSMPDNIDSSPSPQKEPSPAKSDKNPALSIRPINERQPTTALDKTERRKIAQKNTETLATALLQHFADTKRLPQAYARNSSNLPTLSWRVSLLPYLGLEDLHQQFDFSKPWNVEPNKSLLKYIPDAYVSPERFDTNTNFLLPAGKYFIFGENRVPREKTVEDGMGNTIMLFEVNDDYAVPWTKPSDLNATTSEELDAAIGELRENGTFAAWASGLPVLLSSSLTSDQVFAATTHEKGEALRAGDIHRDITEPVFLKLDPESGQMADAKTTAGNASNGNEDTKVARENLPSRLPVPKAADIAKAQDKLRSIYAEKLRSAGDRPEKIKLARTMLSDAAKSRLDPTGAYVMQTAALRLALEAVDVDLLMSAIDARVALFEVDPYEENVSWIQQISATRAKRDLAATRNTQFSKRVLIVTRIGIIENHFAKAAKITGIAYQFTSKKKEDAIPRLINKLKSSLTSTESTFGEALGDLDTYRKYPDDPTAAEAFGMFLCFTKGDWPTGLPLLQKGNNDVLRDIATKDLALTSDSDPRAQAVLADIWWDLGERAKSTSYREPCRQRAAYWYQQAYERLPDSLDRIHVKSRIEEAESQEGGNPVALCSQLAREMGVSLENPRAQLIPNLRFAGNNDDDDD